MISCVRAASAAASSGVAGGAAACWAASAACTSVTKDAWSLSAASRSAITASASARAASAASWAAACCSSRTSRSARAASWASRSAAAWSDCMLEDRLLDGGVLRGLGREHVERAGRRRVDELVDDDGVGQVGRVGDLEPDVGERVVGVGEGLVGAGHGRLRHPQRAELAHHLGVQLAERGGDPGGAQAVDRHEGELSGRAVLAGLLLRGRGGSGPGARGKGEQGKGDGHGGPSTAGVQHPSPRVGTQLERTLTLNRNKLVVVMSWQRSVTATEPILPPRDVDVGFMSDYVRRHAAPGPDVAGREGRRG